MNGETSKEKAAFKIDIFNTIIGNILWIYLMVFILVFIVLGFESIKIISDDCNKVLALIVILFATVKLITWIGRPHISLIERKYLKETEK